MAHKDSYLHFVHMQTLTALIKVIEAEKESGVEPPHSKVVERGGSTPLFI